MRAYMESGFYVIYLVLMIGAGVRLLRDPDRRAGFGLFGAACILLAAGDMFHLVPRSVGLFTRTLDAPGTTLAAWLGVGKLITSVTMTAFYVLFYRFVYRRSGTARSRMTDAAVYVCTALRLVLCAFPQNRWLENGPSLTWGILRNIPFVILGVLVIAAAYRYLRGYRHYKLLWIAIVLSFGFYIPVVLWASSASWVGMLMLPKTVCYLWIARMGCADAKEKAQRGRRRDR